MINTSAIFNVKIDNEWVEIPYVKGTSVHLTGTTPTSQDVTVGSAVLTQTGTQVSLFNESTNTTASFVVWDGLKGLGLHYMGATPTSRMVEGSDHEQTGYIVSLEDEITASTYSFVIWNGIDGTGRVNSVDGVAAAESGVNVQIDAVSYGRSQPSITAAQQSVARANINAQVAGNYIASPSTKNTNEFLKYLGNDQWTTQAVFAFPSGNAGVLVKLNDDTDDLAWSPVISSSDIDNIMS